MKLTNRFDADESIVAAVSNDSYDPEGSDISITGLARSPQQRVLEKRHYLKLTEDVSDRLASLRGQVAHSIVERAGLKNDWSEKRIFVEVNGWKVSGKPDKFESVMLDSGTLIDHKFPTLSSFLFGFQRDKGLKKEHIAQGNSYRYLLHRNGVDVTKIIFKSTLLEWSKRHARVKPEYPDRPFFNFELPIWDMEVSKAYIEERVALHQAAEKLPDDRLPECTDEERWRSGDTWKAYKGDSKRALPHGTFSGPTAQAEAEAFAAEKSATLKATVRAVKVLGEAVKCLDYCKVRNMCFQLKREQPEGVEGLI